MDIVTCDLCITDSCRTNKFRECCEIRMLAKAPRHQQAEIAKKLTQEERDELRPRLINEIKRLKELKK